MTMLRITSLIFALLISWSACAQVPLTGAGKGAPGGGVTFQGPGDIVSGALTWGSCARAYNAAYANGTNPLCDIKDKTTGTVAICTLRVATTGFSDLAGTYCTGSTTPAAACAAAAGGSCIVSKVYDQTGNTRDFTQATAANMPGLVFSALGGLPGLQCGSPAILATANLTQAQPYSLSTVYVRTAISGIGAAIGAFSGSLIIGSGPSANNAEFSAGLATVITSIPDSAFHSFEAVVNSPAGATNSAYNIDGTDVTAINAGTAAFAANALRLCSDGADFLTGKTMEGGLWPTAFTTPQRASINTNQHSVTSGYNF